MKQLEIIVSIEDIEFGKANFIYLKKESAPLSYLILEGFNLTNEIKSSSNILDIKVFYKKQLYSEFELILTKDINYIDMQNVVFYTSTFPKEYSYNQKVIDIFRLWDINEPISWNSLNVKSKRAWLKACLYWSGIPQYLENRPSFIIDGSLVNHEVDLYCILGQVFFGERGYFGQDLHGLEDCINEFYEKGPRNSSVIFMNAQRLERILNKTMKNYMELLIEIFKRGGFVVIKE